jgi:acyl CoA:acetate/3-ketoacid CoA transferase beta subunit
VALGAKEILVTVVQDKMRTPERVSYITAPGKRARTLVTTMGVFEKPPGEDEFVLAAYFPQVGKDSGEAVEKIRSQCGWELRIADNLRRVEEPSQEDLYDVRIFDPRRYFLTEE